MLLHRLLASHKADRDSEAQATNLASTPPLLCASSVGIETDPVPTNQARRQLHAWTYSGDVDGGFQRDVDSLFRG
jgi:hypothetical protein